MPRKTAKPGPVPAPEAAQSMQVDPNSPLNLDAIFDKPEKILPPDLFFRATQEYTPVQGRLWYLYRKWPVIDKCLVKGPKAESFIDKRTEPFADLDAVLHAWGSGDYRLCFTDSAKSRGYARVAQCHFTLRSDDFPPVVDQAELVAGDPKNASYIEGLRVRNLWKGDQKDDMGQDTAMTAAIAALSQRPADSVPKQAIEVMKEAFTFSQQMNNPAEMLKLIAALRDSGGGNEAFLKLLLDQNRANQELMLKFIESSRATNPEKGLTGSLEELMKLDGLMSRFTRRNSAPSESWVQQLIAGAPIIASLIMQAAAAFRSAGPVTAPSPAPGPALVRNPAPVIEMPTPGPQIAPEVPASAGEASAPAPRPEGAPGLSPTAVLDQVLNCIDRGLDGDDFAVAVVVQFGDEAYSQLRALGKTQLLGLFLTLDPGIAQRASLVMPQLETFVNDFLAYGDDPEDGNGQQKEAA